MLDRRSLTSATTIDGDNGLLETHVGDRWDWPIDRHSDHEFIAGYFEIILSPRKMLDRRSLSLGHSFA